MADRTRTCPGCGHGWHRRGKLPRWCSVACTPECSVEGCIRRAQIKDVCRVHRLKERDLPACSVDGCTGKVWARGWCGTHYRRWQRSGSLDDPKPPSGCSIPGCDGGYVVRGLCAKHRWRKENHGDPLWEPEPSPVGSKCAVSGCGRRVCEKSGNGFCRPHYRAHAKWGDPLGDLKRCPVCTAYFYANGTRREMCDKCRRIVSRHAKTMTVEELVARDGQNCALCGIPVDLTLKWPDGMCGTVDHLIPWSRGGTHDESNLQLAHWSCNLRKNNKI